MYGEPLPEKQNAMDLLSDAGFALLGQTMLLPPIIFMFGKYFSPIHLDTHGLYSRMGSSNSKHNGYSSINVSDLGSKKTLWIEAGVGHHLQWQDVRVPMPDRIDVQQLC